MKVKVGQVWKNKLSRNKVAIYKVKSDSVYYRYPDTWESIDYFTEKYELTDENSLATVWMDNIMAAAGKSLSVSIAVAILVIATILPALMGFVYLILEKPIATVSAVIVLAIARVVYAALKVK